MNTTKYWKWWIYLCIGAALTISSFFDLATPWRLVISLAILWYGITTGVELHKETLKRKLVVHERVFDGIKSVHGPNCECYFCEAWRI